MIDNNNILKILLEADADPNDPEKQPNEKPKKPEGFEEDPMGFIIRKYHGLRETLVELMSNDFKQYLTAIFVIAPKPTTFKIVLHNGQFFFIKYMGKNIYEANIAGKRYYLNNIGIKERAMEAIARLLKFGNPLKSKGPEGAEQGTRPETGGGSTGGGGGFGGGAETTETGGEEGTETTETGEETAPESEESLKESALKINMLKNLLLITNEEFSVNDQEMIRVLVKEVNLPSKPKTNQMKKNTEKTVTLYKAIQKAISDDGFKVSTENKGNRGPVLRADFKTSTDTKSVIEKTLSKLLPKGTFKITEFQKNQGESKSSTYPTYKIELVKDINNYKKGESIFVVSTMKEGASTKGKALTPNKLGVTSKSFKRAATLATTIKNNIPSVTNNPKLIELLDSLVDDVLAKSPKGRFKDVSEITKYNEPIQLSERTKKAISQVSSQDLGMIGSDFGECLGAIVLLNSVKDSGSGLIFPADEANPLADFILDGYNVSSKYNKGGAATITDTIKNLKKDQLTTPGQKKLYKIFQTILSFDAIQGPIEVAKMIKSEGLEHLAGLEKLSQIVKIPAQDINHGNLNVYMQNLLKSATTDQQKEGIIKNKFGSFFKLIQKSPNFPLKWRDLSPQRYFGIVTAPLANYVAAYLNSDKVYKKALTDIMSKSEVKQLYLTMNVKQNTANFNLKSFSSSQFEFDSALSAYKPSNKKLAFRIL